MKIYKFTLYNLFLFSLIYLIFSSLYFEKDLEDNALWHYIGWSWTKFSDESLRNFADNKPFGIYFLYYASSKLFGINFIPLIILSLITKIFTGIFIYLILSNLLKDKFFALTGITFFYLLIAWPEFDAGSVTYTETFVNFFIILSIYFLLRYNGNNFLFLLLSLFAIFLGFIFKQTVVFLGPAYVYFIYKKSNNKFFTKFLTSIAILLLFFLIYFFALSNFGIKIEQIIKQTFFPLNYSSDVVMKISSRINNFIYQWTGVYKVITIIIIICVYYYFTCKKMIIDNLLFSSLFFMFVGIHFTGITNGHQLSQILPIISLILPFIIVSGSEKLNFNNYKKYLIVFMLCVAFIPEISLTKIKASINTKNNNNLYNEALPVKIYLDDNYDKIIPVHQHFRNSRFMLTLNRRAASRYINTTFLYAGYGNGNAIKKNLFKLKKDLSKEEKHLLIILDDYKNEPPFRYPLFLERNIKDYKFIKKINSYLIYEKR